MLTHTYTHPCLHTDMRIQIHTHKRPYTPSGIYAINKISALLSVETYLHLQAYNDDEDDDDDE